MLPPRGVGLLKCWFIANGFSDRFVPLLLPSSLIPAILGLQCYRFRVFIPFTNYRIKAIASELLADECLNCRGTNMYHLHARMTPLMIERHSNRAHTNWDGALLLYKKLERFLFGHIEYVDEDPEVLQLHQSLYNEACECGRALIGFIHHVRARTIIDMACRHEVQFELRWCQTDRASYMPWELLEEKCLFWEDVDLLYVGSGSSKPSDNSFTNFTCNFVHIVCVYNYYLCLSKYTTVTCVQIR